MRPIIDPRNGDIEDDASSTKRRSLLSLAGRAVLITGGSHGIGEGCARVFVAAGAAVVIGDRDAPAGETLAAELTAAGPGRCDFVRCEMSQPAEILTVMDMVTNNGAKALRLPDFCVTVGAVADLVVLDAHDAREAFATRSPRRWVIRRGMLIVETRREMRRYFDVPAVPDT